MPRRPPIRPQRKHPPGVQRERGVPDMLAWLLYLIADLLVRALPVRAADALALAVARAAFAAGLPTRRALEENLARLLDAAPPGDVRARARECFASFALSFTDFLRLAHRGPGALEGAVEVHGAEHLEAARRSGRGVILLSAHLGNWELGAAWLAAHGARVNVVARPHASRRVERFFARRREAWGVQRLPAPPLWKAAAEALRRREWVALMADRGPCGRDAARSPVCAWARALSRRTGALVLPAVFVRLPDRRYAACFERPFQPEQERGDGGLEAIRRYLRRYPGQWSAFEPLAGGIA